MADTPTLGLPAHKAPHEALQDALFVYAVGSDGAGADLIRGWPALVERVVADVAGGPWDELLCDLDDWCLDGNDVPFRYSVNFEDGYMAIYRVHDERAAALPSIREIALEHAARATVDTLDLYHSISEGGERYEQLRDALAMPTAQPSPEAAQLVLQAIKAVNALMNGRTPEEALAAGRSAHLAIQSLALLAKPALADDAARWRWWRERFVALCGMHCARAAGLDLSTVYVDSPEKMDAVTDAARLAQIGAPA